MSELDERETRECDECKSLHFVGSSTMAALCPECTHILYGYPACHHEMRPSASGKQRCGLCGWDGSRSDYVRSLL
jgi:hypothetical protein